MAGFEGKFESSFQDWETPEDLFSLLDDRYQFTFDVAANKHNHKCQQYFSITDDALHQTWRGNCWLNPPYGGRGSNKLEKWVIKAYQESLKSECAVAMLIPARTNTNWWHAYCMEAQEVLFIKGRPKFGNAKHGLPQPLAVVYFTGVPKLLCGTLDLRQMGITIRNGRT